MRGYNINLSSTLLFLARVVKITRLDDAILRIAEAEEAVTVSAQTFVPLHGCEISAVKHVYNGGVGSMEIKFAHSDGGTLDTAQLNTGFWDGARVEMYLIDRSTTTTLGEPLFTGLIDTVVIDPIGSSGSFDIRGITVQAEAFIQTFQPMCRTDLFSSLCSLNENDWDHAGTVDTILDRFNCTVSGIGSLPTGISFNQGTFITASGFKGVIANWNQSTLQMTTYQPVCMSRLTVGENVTLYPGCDKTGANCRAYGNKLNFQGEDHFLGINSIVGV